MNRVFILKFVRCVEIFQGSAYNITRGACDNTFRENMLALCGWWNFHRKKVAEFNYHFVQEFRQNLYNETALGWCKDAWVKACL